LPAGAGSPAPTAVPATRTAPANHKLLDSTKQAVGFNEVTP
jgi:hypothetical protein